MDTIGGTTTNIEKLSTYEKQKYLGESIENVKL